METTPCRSCVYLPGCKLLGEGGQFHTKKVLDEKTNPGVCHQFQEVEDREAELRGEMFDAIGAGFLRAIHLYPRDSLLDTETDMTDIPDFVGMIREGMSVEERLDQFLYDTDDNGDFLIGVDGERVPRGQLAVRKYASDPDGPLGSPQCDTAAYWDFDDVLKAVIAAEKKLYGLGGAKKTKKPKKEKETTMTTKPRISFRKPSTSKKDATPGKVKTKAAGGGKVTKAATTKKRTTKKLGSKKSAEELEATSVAEGSGSFDKEEMMALLEARIAPVEAKLDTILAAIGDGPGNRTVQESIRDGLTVMHDALQRKISASFFSMANLLCEDGLPEDLEIEFLDEEDGRDTSHNLLVGDSPVDLFTYYLDGESAEGEDEAEE